MCSGCHLLVCGLGMLRPERPPRVAPVREFPRPVGCPGCHSCGPWAFAAHSAAVAGVVVAPARRRCAGWRMRLPPPLPPSLSSLCSPARALPCAGDCAHQLGVPGLRPAAVHQFPLPLPGCGASHHGCLDLHACAGGWERSCGDGQHRTALCRRHMNPSPCPARRPPQSTRRLYPRTTPPAATS